MCQRKACAQAKTSRCKYKRAGHDTDTRVAKWVEPSDMTDKTESSAEASSSKDTSVCRAKQVVALVTVSQALKKENMNMDRTRKETRKGSMEDWPSNFGVLIDLWGSIDVWEVSIGLEKSSGNGKMGVSFDSISTWTCDETGFGYMEIGSLADTPCDLSR
jgi:hypothetical protein